VYGWFASGETDRIGCTFLSDASLVEGINAPANQQVLVRAAFGEEVAAAGTRQLAPDELLQLLDLDTHGMVSVTEFLHGLCTLAVIAKQTPADSEVQPLAFDANTVKAEAAAAAAEKAQAVAAAAAAAANSVGPDGTTAVNAVEAALNSLSSAPKINLVENESEDDEEAQPEMDSDEDLPECPESDDEDNAGSVRPSGAPQVMMRLTPGGAQRGGSVVNRASYYAPVLAVRCPFFDRNLHSRMSLAPTPAHLKRATARPMSLLSDVHLSYRFALQIATKH
jgi:hypothetical protein